MLICWMIVFTENNIYVPILHTQKYTIYYTIRNTNLHYITTQYIALNKCYKHDQPQITILSSPRHEAQDTKPNYTLNAANKLFVQEYYPIFECVRHVLANKLQTVNFRRVGEVADDFCFIFLFFVDFLGLRLIYLICTCIFFSVYSSFISFYRLRG